MFLVRISLESLTDIRPFSRGRVLLSVVLFSILWYIVADVDPIWHDRNWPTRHEADGLPDSCKVFSSDAARLFPQVSPNGISSYEGDQNDGCEWVGIDPRDRLNSRQLRLTYTLFRFAVAKDGGTEQARKRFSYEDAEPANDSELAGIADDVRMTIADDPIEVHIQARKRNVIADLVYTPFKDEDEPTAIGIAERLARQAMAAIVLR